MWIGPSVKGTGENASWMVLGDGSQIRMAAFWMMTDSATVASIGISMRLVAEAAEHEPLDDRARPRRRPRTASALGHEEVSSPARTA